MNSTHYLYAAYAATWIIHLAYLGTLVGRYQALQRRLRELKKDS